MKPVVAVLLVAVVAMAVWLRSQSASIRELELAVQQLGVKAPEQARAASLDLQAKCSDQARKAFADLGYKKNDLAFYENHYNAHLNKCIIQSEHTDAKSGSGAVWTFRNVFDAFEGRQYGTYVWHTVKNKKYWEVPPFQCEVTLPSGEKKSCQSADEFAELVKVYMEGGG